MRINMKSINIGWRLLWMGLCGVLFTFYSCDQDTDDLQEQANLLKERITAIEKAADSLNESVAALQYLLSGTSVVGVTAVDNGYKLELADGQSFTLVDGGNVDGLLPQLKISDEGYWMYSLDEGSTYQVLTDSDGAPMKAYPVNESGEAIVSPLLHVSSDGYWQVSCDGGTTYADLLNANGVKVSALAQVTSSASLFSRIYYNSEGDPVLYLTLKDGTELSYPVINTFYLKIYDEEGTKELTEADVQVFSLAEMRTYKVEQSDVTEAVIQAPEGWTVTLSESQLSVTSPSTTDAEVTEEIKIVITSSRQYVRVVTLNVKLVNSYEGCAAWLAFCANTSDNVLLDFSYAGYSHGEQAPPEVDELIAQGYMVYDVTKYGAVANDDISDREAFIKTLEAATDYTRVTTKDGNIRILKENAKAIIYFPEGEYILQGSTDKVNECLHLTMGNFVIRGAGRDKTVLRMDVQNKPATESNMWSTPTLIEIKHYSDVSNLTSVTADADKGSFSVEVASTTGITAGSWVRLYMKNNSTAAISEELSPYSSSDLDASAAIVTGGVEVMDYHQVKSMSGTTVTFYEPLMHEVKAEYDWVVQSYPHYENVGVEDLCFKGNAKEEFKHHGSAADDSGFKLIDFGRLTNSWMRRVNFVSVSEALSVVNSANVSVYDVEISGNRGHSAIRSQASSRVFIGKVYDHSSGYELTNSGGNVLGSYMENAGQYHACGVSKQSLGAVIWNVQWGDDACFESHATQPRATLIDCCTGGFMQWREGGDLVQLPNHLDDLVIWNMNATAVKATDNNPFVWWSTGTSNYWKNLPPVIVGFHGQTVNFSTDANQVKYLESNGAAVTPNSLYEAQLEKRLGGVPAWLNALK